ncbi:unnamed protein product [Symbiodinium sp. CCMP2592]|nr:unnamed protein product [Symbiodinium sp. CCMP2592]
MANCSLEGLASQWDQDEALREDLRQGKPLIAEVSEKQVDIHMPSRYNRLLLPVLHRMRDASKKLPGIDELRHEIRKVLKMNKRDPTDEEVDRFGWLIRKNLGFIKMKCRRQEVPDFQQLCLALDPDLQGIVDQINESLARRRARAETAQETSDDEDAYDDDGDDGADDDQPDEAGGCGLSHHLNDFMAAVGESAPEASAAEGESAPAADGDAPIIDAEAYEGPIENAVPDPIDTSTADPSIPSLDSSTTDPSLDSSTTDPSPGSSTVTTDPSLGSSTTDPSLGSSTVTTDPSLGSSTTRKTTFVPENPGAGKRRSLLVYLCSWGLVRTLCFAE